MLPMAIDVSEKKISTILRFTTDWTLLVLRIFGYSIISSFSVSMRMPRNGQRHGMHTKWRSEVRVTRAHERCSPLVWFKTVFKAFNNSLHPRRKNRNLLTLWVMVVDWDVNDDPVLMAHLLYHNPQDFSTYDLFGPSTTPHWLSDVPRKASDLLTIAQVYTLNTLLAQQIDTHSCNMQTRRFMWQHTLAICSTFI